MSRILGIDWGEKRIGLAISDPSGLIASGLPTFEKSKSSDFLAYLKNFISTENISQIVLGFPKNMDGTVGFKGKEVLVFKENLEKEIDIPITLWDERLSTVSALKSLREGEVKWRKQKKMVDRVSAIFILQSYLDGLPDKK